MHWEQLLRPILGPFSGSFEGQVAIKRANRDFAHIKQFITEVNDRFAPYIASGLIGSEGASLTAWSRQGDHIVSSLRLRSVVRKRELIVPLRIKVGQDHVTIGDTSVLLSDNEAILNAIARAVSNFFSM